MTVEPIGKRLDYLDSVRAFALLLGVVFHAAFSFMPVYVLWAVMDVSTSPLVSTFTLISHSFRMELFFLIAGFFSHMTFHSKGTKTFLKSRFVRIIIPFVIGWFILHPLIISCWIMGSASLRGDVDILSGLIQGFQTFSNLPNGLFTGSHLWFLYYMILTTTFVLTARFALTQSSHIKTLLQVKADASISWLAHSRLSIPALAIPTAICLLFMSLWGMDTPAETLIPHIPVLIIYSGFFSLGWLFHRQTQLMDRFTRLTLGRFALCLNSIVATVILSDFQSDTSHPHHEIIKGGFSLSYAFMMWTLVMLCIGLFKRYLDRPSNVVRYIADSSYWIYLVHFPIVVWLQIAFAELDFHWSLKLIAISCLTIGFSLLMYDLFVRSSFIGAILNGRRKPRAIFTTGKSRPATLAVHSTG